MFIDSDQIKSNQSLYLRVSGQIDYRFILDTIIS